MKLAGSLSRKSPRRGRWKHKKRKKKEQTTLGSFYRNRPASTEQTRVKVLNLQTNSPHTAVPLLSQLHSQRQCYTSRAQKGQNFFFNRSEPEAKARRKKYQKCENSLRRTEATENQERERKGTEKREKDRERERKRTRKREKG